MLIHNEGITRVSNDNILLMEPYPTVWNYNITCTLELHLYASEKWPGYRVCANFMKWGLNAFISLTSFMIISNLMQKLYDA